MRKSIPYLIGGVALLIGLDAHAATAATTTTATAIPSLTIAQVGQQSISLPLQILALMSAITLLPAILLSTTAFTRVVIVFGAPIGVSGSTNSIRVHVLG